MTLKIYGVLRSRASRTVWLCKELGIPYEILPVMQAYRLADPGAADALFNTASPDFLAINPNGHIPSIDDDGFILHESLAINLYLAKKHGGPLAPGNAREDAAMTMWALWAATECETHALNLLNNQRLPVPDKVVYAAESGALRKPLSVLEQMLRDGHGHLVGGRFTVADANLVEVLRYAQTTPEVFDGFDAIRTWMNACQNRPAYKAMWAEREKEPA